MSDVSLATVLKYAGIKRSFILSVEDLLKFEGDVGFLNVKSTRRVTVTLRNNIKLHHLLKASCDNIRVSE